MQIGERIKQARKAKGLTQKEVAARAGMADSAIRKYEAGKQIPKIETLSRIADAIGCDMWELAPPSRAVSYGAMMADMDHRKWIEGWMDEGYTFSGPENDLIFAFSQMNADGQFCAVRLVQDLAQVPKYKKPSGGGPRAVDPQENDEGRA